MRPADPSSFELLDADLDEDDQQRRLTVDRSLASGTNLTLPGSSTHRFSVYSASSYADLSVSAQSALGNTWRGDPETDWIRCHKVLKAFPRDGKKLEIWSDWLGLGREPAPDYQVFTVKANVKGKAKGAVEDDGPGLEALGFVDPIGALRDESFAEPEHGSDFAAGDSDNILAVLRAHVRMLLQTKAHDLY